MSTLNRYLSNATKKGISAQQSYDNLISEFRKGNVSYPRTDGKNHAPLKVLDENNIKIGYIDSITVDINYSGHGIGTLLLKETISRLKESNTTFSIMAGWKNKDQVNIRNLATKEGFKEEFTIENFWKDDSIEFNFDCTACGSPPCLCSAIIYTKF